MKKTTKYIVKVAWNRESSEIAANKGWEALEKKARNKKKYPNVIEAYEMELDTKAEADAYMQGIEDGSGWDCPYYELIKPK